MRNMGKMRKLILDLQHDLAVWIVPDSKLSDKDVLLKFLERLDGPQAREALTEEEHHEKRGYYVSLAFTNVAICALSGLVCWITKSPWGLIALFAVSLPHEPDYLEEEEKEND